MLFFRMGVAIRDDERDPFGPAPDRISGFVFDVWRPGELAKDATVLWSRPVTVVEGVA